MKRLLACCASALALSACATTPASAQTPAMAEAQLAAPEQLQSTPPPTQQAPTRPSRPVSPQEAVLEANRAARQRPDPAHFVDATQFYAYQAGAIYELYTSPAYVSTILLEPGETLADAAAGDTANWMVSNTQAGAAYEARTLVMVKPHHAGLRTNLVLVTDRRTYLIEASSAAGQAYSAQIAWRYPADAVAAQTEAARPFNTLYRIRTTFGRTPDWAPTRVYDDGRRTWIEFPDTIAASDMPPLFVRTGEGAEIVNYRIQGNVYMVDRLFDVAELRLGRAQSVIVRIERRRRP